jgi:hypothetical protein
MKKNETVPQIDMATLQEKLKSLNSQISVKLEIITPKTALEYLKNNLNDDGIRNRKIDSHAVERYVKDIEAGRFLVGETIKFDTKGNMIDGQSRCTAIYKANIPILCFVMRGLHPDTFAVIDGGKKRTIKDTLTTLKSADGKQLLKATQVGAAVVIANNIKNNAIHVEKNWMLTNSEVFEIVKNDFEYYNEPFTSKKISNWRKNIKLAIPESHLAAFYYIHKKSNGDMVDTFLDILTSNDNTTPEIVRKFRDMVMSNKGRDRFDKRYMTPSYILKLINVLFKYYQQKGGLNRKSFTKSDLE